MAYFWKIYFNLITHNQLIFIIIIFLRITLQKNIYSKKFSEITLTIAGSGDKKILSNTKICGNDNNIPFNQMPDRIIIDNETKNFSSIIINFKNDINIIKLQWDNPVTNCRLMFDRVYDIISVDFSRFDTSKITDMRCMFCQSRITSLNLTNFNISLVVNMRSMFNYCINLETLDLSNFDTSKVTDLYHIFIITHL